VLFIVTAVTPSHITNRFCWPEFTRLHLQDLWEREEVMKTGIKENRKRKKGYDGKEARSVKGKK
jgi:hypothetical protein